MSTQAERQRAMEQALASARIEGFKPGPEFLADCKAVVEGRLTHEQAIAHAAAQAIEADRAARVESSAT